jgi:predicted acylesterase/phospholipase RssA
MTTTSSPATVEGARNGAPSSMPSKPAAWRCYPGGASHVLTIAAADEALDEVSVPLGYSGVSAGALVALARAFRVPHARIYAVLTRLLKGNAVLDVAPFELGDGGLCGWHVIPDAIDELLGPGRRLGEAPLPVIVVVTDLDTGTPQYIDSRNPAHANILVRELARATSAIPGVAPQMPIPSWRLGLYTPGITLKADGGVTDNTADDVFDTEAAPRIALRLVDDAPMPRVRHWAAITQALAVFRAMLWASSRIKSKRSDGLVIDVDAEGSGFNFDLTAGEMQQRRSAGRRSVQRRARDIRQLRTT